MPLPLEPDPFDRDLSDPLLLFAEEPKAVAAQTPPAPDPPQISPGTDQPVGSPELDAMRSRAEAAEQALLEARRTVTALKREMATLVTAATNKPAVRHHRRRGVTMAGLAVIPLAVTGWYFTPGMPRTTAPAIAATVEPPPAAALPPAPSPSLSPPPPPVVASSPQSPRLPARAARVRAVDAAPARVSREYFGTLSVDAVPDGGEVFINRKSVGKTPARITGLRAGSHLVWIERPGYRLWTRVVLVPADKVSRVSVALEPQPAAAPRP